MHPLLPTTEGVFLPSPGSEHQQTVAAKKYINVKKMEKKKKSLDGKMFSTTRPVALAPLRWPFLTSTAPMTNGRLRVPSPHAHFCAKISLWKLKKKKKDEKKK